MRRRAAAMVVATVSTVAGMGCSLLVDTSNLAAGSTDAEAPRETSAIEDGSDGEASDADASDASPSCDAGFCDDFDESPLGARWTTRLVENGGLTELGTPALSTPNALRAHFATMSGNVARYAMLEKDFGAVSGMRCDFALYVESRADVGLVDVFRLHATGPADLAKYHLLFGMATGSADTFREDLFYTDGGCDCPRKDTNPLKIPDKRWVQVHVETDFVTALLSYDGVVVTSSPFGNFKPSSIQVAIGSIAYQSSASSVLFDDLRCSAIP